jgi:hypothetical protein
MDKENYDALEQDIENTQKDLEQSKIEIEKLKIQQRRDRIIKIVLIIIIILLLLFWLLGYRMGRIGYEYSVISTNSSDEKISIVEITQNDLEITKNART